MPQLHFRYTTSKSEAEIQELLSLWLQKEGKRYSFLTQAQLSRQGGEWVIKAHAFEAKARLVPQQNQNLFQMDVSLQFWLKPFEKQIEEAISRALEKHLG